MGSEDESPIKKVIKLKRLYEKGLIDEEEFEQLKRRTLFGEEVEPAAPTAIAPPSGSRSSRLMKYALLGFVVGLLVMLIFGVLFAVYYTSPAQPCNGSSLVVVNTEKLTFALKSVFSALPFVEKPDFVLESGSGRIVVNEVDEQHGVLSMAVQFELKNNASRIASPAGEARLILENELTGEKVFSRKPVPSLVAGESKNMSFPFVFDGSLGDVEHFHIAALTVLVAGGAFPVVVENETFERVLFVQLEGKGGNETRYVVGGLLLGVSSSHLAESLITAYGRVLAPSEGMSYLMVQFNVHNAGKTTAHIRPISDSAVEVEGVRYVPTEQNYKLPPRVVLEEEINPAASVEGMVVYQVPNGTERATALWLINEQTLRWELSPEQP